MNPPPMSPPPPAPSSSNRWIKWALLALVLVGGCSAVFMWGATRMGKQMVASVEQTAAEGEAAGQGKTQDDCLDEAHRRYDGQSMTVMPAAIGFTAGCLKVATASPGFCDGIEPGAEDRTEVQRRVTERCQQDVGCSGVETAHVMFCAKGSAAP